MARLRDEALLCRRCALCESRTSVVFGEGPVGAELMIVGDAPDREDDEQGRPFVGNDGQMLTAMVEKGLRQPRVCVYVATIIRCRPPADREPRREEIAACLPFLFRQIERVRPRAILCLGAVAANALTGQDSTLDGLRGRWFEARGIPVRVTHPPSWLLQQREKQGGHTPADRETYEDLKEVAQRLGWSVRAGIPPAVAGLPPSR